MSMDYQIAYNIVKVSHLFTLTYFAPVQVKLKYKMPFAIDVRSRVREEPAPEPPAETPPAELPVVGCEQEFSSAPQPEQSAVISIQG